MKTITDKQAQADLPALLEQTATSCKPVQINGTTASAVLVAEEDWRSLKETLYLLSAPGKRGSIGEDIQAPLEQYFSEPELTLKQLLVAVTPNNLPAEFQAGPAVGQEAW